MRSLTTCLLLATAACSPVEKRAPSYEYSVLTVCRTGADVIETLTVRHMEDPLTEKQIKRTAKAIAVIDGVCMQEDIPEKGELVEQAAAAVKELLLIEEVTR